MQVFLNHPVFWIRDPTKFPRSSSLRILRSDLLTTCSRLLSDFIRSQKRNPQTHLTDYNVCIFSTLLLQSMTQTLSRISGISYRTIMRPSIRSCGRCLTWVHRMDSGMGYVRYMSAMTDRARSSRHMNGHAGNTFRLVKVSSQGF